MNIYNTLSKKVEPFVPYSDKEITLYTCGPTVYHYAHIGNLRTYIMEDILERTLRYLGYSVKRVMNITDVGHLSSDSDTGEDKMLKGAKRENKSVLEIAQFYTDAFFNDCNKLNIIKPKIIAPATNHIAQYIHIIEVLLEKEYAYTAGGNIYFDVSKLEDYYVLTNHKEDDMVVGAREGVDEDIHKRNQADFVLWFTRSKFEDQELKWDSPWGIGYPGWHIECSGISVHYLGEYLDIHCGGVDNIFPHHTNEIAQSEAYLGHPWCKYWVHGGHLNDISGKMSKSKGETLTVSLLEKKGYMPLAYRFFCLNSHYRNQLVFTYDALDNAANAYEKLIRKTRGLTSEGNIDEAVINTYLEKFSSAIGDDLNTSKAITVLYDVLKAPIGDASKYQLVGQFDQVLGLDLLKQAELDLSLMDYIEQKIIERNQAKQNKDYQTADLIRQQLEQEGILLKDTKEGTIFEVKEG